MKFSIVIPCYNCAATVGDTLDSLLAQSYSDFEIITVDDGSTDDTAAVLNRYRDRVCYVHQPNAGVSAARNNGVVHATGEWIAFCDSDDLWVPQKLELVQSAIRKVPMECDFVFSDYSIMDDGVISARRGMMSDKTMFPVFREFSIAITDMFEYHTTIPRGFGVERDECIDVLYGNIFSSLILGNVILPSAAVVRKAAFEKVGRFRDHFRNAEDTEFFLRIARESNFIYVDEPLITYKRISTSLLSTSMRKTMENGVRAVEINCRDDEVTYGRFRSTVDRSLARKYSRLAYFHLSELDSGAARLSARTALRYRRAERLAWVVLIASLVPRSVLAAVRGLLASLKS